MNPRGINIRPFKDIQIGNSSVIGNPIDYIINPDQGRLFVIDAARLDLKYESIWLSHTLETAVYQGRIEGDLFRGHVAEGSGVYENRQGARFKRIAKERETYIYDFKN